MSDKVFVLGNRSTLSTRYSTTTFAGFVLHDRQWQYSCFYLPPEAQSIKWSGHPEFDFRLIFRLEKYKIVGAPLSMFETNVIRYERCINRRHHNLLSINFLKQATTTAQAQSHRVGSYTSVTYIMILKLWSSAVAVWTWYFAFVFMAKTNEHLQLGMRNLGAR
jgi:hypothetical protein